MVVRGNANGAVIYWNIDANNGWHHPVNLYGNYKQAFMSMISLKPYTALMLGGYSHPSGQNIQTYGHQCFHLDTNSSEPVWEAMDDMPIKRAYFEFETYGDAAYAIAGHNGDGEISR